MTAVSQTATSDESANCKQIADSLYDLGLWQIPGLPQQHRRIWRISPEPFRLSPDCVSLLEKLGPALLSLYTAANSIYLRGSYPWFNDYLDRGKPQSLVDFAHMNFQKRRLPIVIRPDIILGSEQDYVTELDSVPGGIGLTDCLSFLYGKLGFDLIGGERGMLNGFAEAIASSTEQKKPTSAIIVSEESNDYRTEMDWLSSELRGIGWNAQTIRPEQVTFTEDGLFLGQQRIDAVYRFFELFDLKNIPKAELMMYAAKKKLVVVTPPYKHYLEEKSLLALFHHPLLESEWIRRMGEDEFCLLKSVIPKTWILDNRPAPPHTVIPDFEFRSEAINDWRLLKDASQKERRLVIKPSGFSPLAWGSHGVVVGHDVSQEDWAAAVENGLNSFSDVPYVFQHFHEGKRFSVRYYDEEAADMREMQGRVRLSPYYFVAEGTARLGGALATICPSDKKLIHGMTDAVMVPCGVGF